jgi:hypothetical protein
MNDNLTTYFEVGLLPEHNINVYDVGSKNRITDWLHFKLYFSGNFQLINNVDLNSEIW